MWLLAAATYFACKVLTWSALNVIGVPVWRQLAYLFAWPGMNADRFLDESRIAERAPPTEWVAGTFKMTSGVVVFWAAQYWIGRSHPIALGWAGMIGTILTFHFGSFHLMSCFWRAVGIVAPPLMNRPTRSTSVAEFWGRRWNTAFRDLTLQFLFRPLARRTNPIAALLIGFVASGLIHDAVISIPAKGGYGGPTLFFSIQAAAILIERTTAGRPIGLARGWRGWVFTAVVLLVPSPLLFHKQFVTQVVVPFMEALGAA
jgi:alginate O-acetyltransferase complex protein AlgI